MTRDQELLREYLEHTSEAAFAELVRRHLDLVYDTGLRLVGGDAALAQDVAQTVFIDLARKAGKLVSYATLAGWLHTRSRFAALDAIRAEQRRRARENEASVMNDQLHDTTPDLDLQWRQLAPVLDQALGDLKQSDRDALLLRFFKGKSLREVGEVLGVQENAARMRVDRALDKLRAILQSKGLTSTASALSGALAGYTLVAAPPGLLPALTGIALAAAAGSTGVTSTALSFMTLTNLKVGIAGVAIVAGLTTRLVIQQRQLAALRSENQELRNALAERAPFPPQGADMTAPAEQDEAQRRLDHSELLRLRGQVGVLRQQLADAAAKAQDNKRSAETDKTPATTGDTAEAKPPVEAWELGKYLGREQWQDAGSAAPEDSLQTLFWALATGSAQRLAELSMTNSFVSDETPEKIAEKVRSGKMRLAPAAVVASPPDYSQLLGGQVALKIEKSPRELQINVDEHWPEGRRVQSVWTLRLENGQWKFPPDIVGILSHTPTRRSD